MVATSAHAKKSTELVRDDPRGQYLILKSVFKENLPSANKRPRPKRSDEIDLTDCVAGQKEYATTDQLTNSLLQTASEIVVATELLRWAGYPTSIWQNALAEYERQQLASIVAGRGRSTRAMVRMERTLIANLDVYRRTSGGPLPKIVSDTGCGGIGNEVTVVTVPSGGKVKHRILLWDRFCTRQGLVPKDVECDRWDEARDGEVTQANGIHYYQATWPRGPASEGRIEFSPTQRTWTIRQPSH
jgi:hypothetical protein